VVATVSGGVVTAVGNGSATITATCGEYSATCEVGVSGISTGGGSSGEEVAAAYEITDTTFNGSSDYVDTGVALFDSAKDFTMFVDFTDGYTSAPAQANVLHCMRESSGYPGITLHRSGNAYQFQMPGSFNKNITGDANGMSVKFVVRRSGNDVAWREWNSVSQSVDSGTSTTTLSDVTQNLLIGAYQTTAGTKGRYWKGTINRCSVWLSALSDEAIDALFA
jgi:hypothetical protein